MRTGYTPQEVTMSQKGDDYKSRHHSSEIVLQKKSTIDKTDSLVMTRLENQQTQSANPQTKSNIVTTPSTGSTPPICIDLEKRISPSPRRISPSPKRTSLTPRKTSPSPRKTSPSPKKTCPSPRKIPPSPGRTYSSPRRTSTSTRKTPPSPKRTFPSPMCIAHDEAISSKETHCESQSNRLIQDNDDDCVQRFITNDYSIPNTIASSVMQYWLKALLRKD